MTTIETLAGFLGIQTSKIALKNGEFHISNAEIQKIENDFFKLKISVFFEKCIFEYKLEYIYQNEKQKIETQMEFLECTLKKGIYFQGCIFTENVEFLSCHSQGEVVFFECDFQKSFKFCKEVYGRTQSDAKIEKDMAIGLCNLQDLNLNNLFLYGNLYFATTIVAKEAIFEDIDLKQNFHTNLINYKNENGKIKKYDSKVVFQEDASFRNAKFEGEALFHFCLFEKYSDFSNCIFKDYTSFCQVFFEKEVLFCGAIFKKAPLFNQVVVGKNMNFLNAEMDFIFYEIKNQIKERIKILQNTPSFKDKTKGEICEKISNDFQDSFCLIKNTLVKNGNSLEALKYHKMELYAKEISLFGTTDKGRPPKDYNDACKNVGRLKNLIDSLQLAFYRHLSDHHTDLLKIINNWIMVTCFYAFFVFVFSEEKFLKTYDIDMQDFLSFLKTSPALWHIVILSILFILTIFLVFSFYKDMLKDFLGISKNKQEGITFLQFISQDFLTFKSLILYCSCFFLAIFFTFEISQSFETIIENFFPPTFIFLNLMIFVAINIPIFVRSILVRNIMIFLSYLVFFTIVLPNFTHLISPIAKGLLGQGESFSLKQSHFIVLICLYAILQSIILWSLQKTARKNSIIPS